MDRCIARLIIPTFLVTVALGTPAPAQREPVESLLRDSGLAVASAIVQAGTEIPTPNNPYTPPACTGIFADVPCPAGFAVNWIEQFYNDGITSGCGAGNYCPDSPTTRAQMAVFIEKAMRGTATWSPGDAGNSNTFLGSGAGLNTWGDAVRSNTATGFWSLYLNTTGNNNTATGRASLYSSTTGNNNTAMGYGSLNVNSTGNNNTAIGIYSAFGNTTGSFNTFVGNNTSAASGGLVNASAIGNSAVVDASYHVRIGDTTVTQIGGQVAWSNLSDARAKTNIRDLDLGLDFVMALRPVSFTLKQGDGRTDMGFIAQDVEALLGDGHNLLGIGGDTERTLSLRYTDLIAPMVKAFQEQQATITELQTAIVAVQEENQGQRAANRALEARLAELERKLTSPPR